MSDTNRHFFGGVYFLWSKTDMIMLMNEGIVYTVLVLFGAAFGSFAGAMVWRLRARELADDKAAGEKIDTQEYKRLKPLIKQSFWKGRSLDLDTGKELAWYELIPVASWLFLRGRSRYTGKPIGKFELIIELMMIAFFAGSYMFWPYALDTWQAISFFGLWLTAGVAMAILFVYDLRWFLLPDRIVFPLIAVGIGMFGIRLSMTSASGTGEGILSTALAVVILAGLYFSLHGISKGKWVGLGDAKLGIFLGLALGTWPLALLCLFLANFIGCLYVMPAMMMGKVTRSSRVPFGPFLILGFVVTMLFGQRILDWYMNMTFVG